MAAAKKKALAAKETSGHERVAALAAADWSVALRRSDRNGGRRRGRRRRRARGRGLFGFGLSVRGVIGRGQLVGMRRRRFREQRVRVDLAVCSPFSSFAFFRRPALALCRCGDRVVVSCLATFGLDSVVVVAIHLPRGNWINMAREDGAVVVERMRLAGVIS
eukprot:3702125-Pleurochrysis_carterae.AAC.1